MRRIVSYIFPQIASQHQTKHATPWNQQREVLILLDVGSDCRCVHPMPSHLLLTFRRRSGREISLCLRVKIWSCRCQQSPHQLKYETQDQEHESLEGDSEIGEDRLGGSSKRVAGEVRKTWRFVIDEDSHEELEERTRRDKEGKCQDQNFHKVYNHQWVGSVKRFHTGVISKVERDAWVGTKSQQFLENVGMAIFRNQQSASQLEFKQLQDRNIILAREVS